ncbi:hypothetical protein Tco_0628758 [Tanacetum coccineum]|uniref:Uncharacterized protein n=1 Tax=Tanacetum coccineum TaxID=301880 RepID=A0ABQ4WRZ3_9ASTR
MVTGVRGQEGTGREESISAIRGVSGSIETSVILGLILGWYSVVYLVGLCLRDVVSLALGFCVLFEGEKPPKDKGVASGSNGGDIDQFDPLYLHSNDINGIPLIGFKLEGTENVTPPNGAWTEYTCPGA